MNNWGGKRAGAGRPIGSVGSYKTENDKATKRLVICCTELEYNQIKELAKIENKSVSQFILKKVLV